MRSIKQSKNKLK